MRLPRRSVGTLMVFVAIVALGIAVMRRPYPIGGASILGLGIVYWSDGTTTKGKVAVPRSFGGLGRFLKVEWSDGGVSWYFGRFARTDAVYAREQASRCAWTLRNDPSEARRKAAADWITFHADRIPADLVVPALASAVNDQGLEVRLSVAAALERFVTRSSSAITALTRALSDEDALVRVMAAYVLGKVSPEMEDARAMAISALVRALKDGNAAVRCRAARSLLAIRGADPADPAVIAALEVCHQ